MKPGSLFLAIGLLFFGPAWSSAQESPRTKSASNVLERFEVNRNGDVLLLPVTFKGKVYQFIFGTSANFTAYDTSLPLGVSKDIKNVDSAGGPVDLKSFDPPDAKVGNLRCPTGDQVGALDFSKFREVSGYEEYGVIGMDFLKKYIIRLDCDRGEVLFLKSVEANAGTPIQLEFERGFPFIQATLPGLGKTRFLLDSGTTSNACGRLIPASFARLTGDGSLRLIGEGKSVSLAAANTVRGAQGKSLAVGEFAIASPVFSSTRFPFNTLDMAFLSRFVVTFDFPNETMYLQKGKRYDAADLWDLSGLHILRRNGATIVHSVDKESVSEARGIKAGDKITKIGDRKAEDISMFEVRRLLSQPGNLQIVIERDGRMYSAALALKQ